MGPVHRVVAGGCEGGDAAESGRLCEPARHVSVCSAQSHGRRVPRCWVQGIAAVGGYASRAFGRNAGFATTAVTEGDVEHAVGIEKWVCVVLREVVECAPHAVPQDCMQGWGNALDGEPECDFLSRSYDRAGRSWRRCGLVWRTHGVRHGE